MGQGKPNEVLGVKSPKEIVVEPDGGFLADFVGTSLLVQGAHNHIWIV
jgi:hypothetical protein